MSLNRKQINTLTGYLTRHCENPPCQMICIDCAVPKKKQPHSILFLAPKFGIQQFPTPMHISTNSFNPIDQITRSRQ